MTTNGRAARQEYERALACHLDWRDGLEDHLSRAMAFAPGFAMAHVLRAYALLAGRDARRVRSAIEAVAPARGSADAEVESHLAVIDAVTADDYDGAKTRLAAMLRADSRDALVLATAASLDYLTSDPRTMLARIRPSLAAMASGGVPGDPSGASFLAMASFAFQECGELDRARALAGEALERDPGHPRGHHAMAHVFESEGRHAEGRDWMLSRLHRWSSGTHVARHAWWHVALFHLEAGDPAAALAIHDTVFSPRRVAGLGDLIDAAALLWRLRLRGLRVEGRARVLAPAWDAYVEDAFCTFNDVHAMLAFVAAEDRPRGKRLVEVLRTAAQRPTRHGATTRSLGLPAAQALLALAKGDTAAAVEGLAALHAEWYRIGGSGAQRSVLRLTQRYAEERSGENFADAGVCGETALAA